MNGQRSGKPALIGSPSVVETEQPFSRPFISPQGSPIRALFKYLDQPGMLSLAGGYPDPALFDETGLRAASTKASASLSRCLQYGATEGLPALRATLAQLNSSRGVESSSSNVLVTTGSQQALNLIIRVTIDEGDAVFVEGPTYPAALQALRFAGARIFTVPSDAEGIDVEALKRLAGTHRPKLLYLVPTFANPSGATLSLSRRLDLVAACADARVMIVEDDPYSELRFVGERVPTLAEIARLSVNHATVVYLSTLSKTVSPGLRVGWLTASKEILKRCAIAKQVDDLCTSPWMQEVAHHYIESDSLSRHLPHLITRYRERCEALVASLSATNAFEFSAPLGGMFVWARLKADIDTTVLLARAIENRVVFVPGQGFFADSPDVRSMRFSFAMQLPSSLAEGVARICKAVEGIGRSEEPRRLAGAKL